MSACVPSIKHTQTTSKDVINPPQLPPWEGPAFPREPLGEGGRMALGTQGLAAFETSPTTAG